MDRDALERSLARRLLDHLENRTTDLADEVLELSTDIYSAERHREEVEVLFRARPLLLCLSGALPESGAFHTVDLCGVPIVLTRNRERKVRAFANICRHRGVRLVDGAGRANRFSCPFHGWTYDLDGNLVAVQRGEAFAGMCKEHKGLVELPVAEGYGLVVGRLGPGAPVDIDEYLGPGLVDELAVLDFADWRPYGEPHVHHVNANWKVTLDTFRENYHFRYLHRRTLAQYAHGGVLTFDPFGPHLRNCSALRSIDELFELPQEQWGDVGRHLSLQYALFPNVSLTFDSRHLELWQILPVDADRSDVLHTAYLRPDLTEAEREKVVEMAPWICETVVDGEDFWVANRTEPGVRTGLLDTVIFGRNEPAPQHLHRGFAAALRAHARSDGA
jgi:phenylpropionate dioxygenase-like ring-hydroxylating dioxygenase large terminal subunit